jgi:hypothetical protein
MFDARSRIHHRSDALPADYPQFLAHPTPSVQRTLPWESLCVSSDFA